jgi:hypothetical protein
LGCHGFWIATRGFLSCHAHDSAGQDQSVLTLFFARWTAWSRKTIQFLEIDISLIHNDLRNIFSLIEFRRTS